MSYEVCFYNGRISFIFPKPAGTLYDNRDIIYDAERISVDGEVHDLTSISSIESIPVPTFDDSISVHDDLGVTGSLEYVLRMHASRLWKIEKYDLALACIEKTTEIMFESPIGWCENDFYRVVQWYEEIGRFSKALEWQHKIEENSNKISVGAALRTRIYNEVKINCLAMGTDLVLIPWENGRSAVSAKYQGRVYTMHGNDWRFPKLPKFILKTGYVEPDGAFVRFPIVFFNDRKQDRIYYKGEERPMLHTSWRPFVDDRDEDEIEVYNELQRSICLDKEHRLNHSIYYRVRYLLPDLCPKSLSGFTRIKNQNSDKYQKLVEELSRLGFAIPDTTIEIEEPIDPEPNYHGGRIIKPFILPWK